MRVLIKGISLALAVIAGGAVLPAAADVTTNLSRIEARGLGGISANRLQTLVKQPAGPTGSAQFTRNWLMSQPNPRGSNEWRCLSEALYFEARGETIQGQFAVAEVIKNRVKSARFPGSFCGVIHQGTGKKYQCQFTYTCDGHAEVISEPAAFARVGKIARAVLDNKVPDITNGATHYHTTAVNPRWASVYQRVASIGVHRFYRHTWKP